MRDKKFRLECSVSDGDKVESKIEVGYFYPRISIEKRLGRM